MDAGAHHERDQRQVGEGRRDTGATSLLQLKYNGREIRVHQGGGMALLPLKLYITIQNKLQKQLMRIINALFNRFVDTHFCYQLNKTNNI